MTLRITEETVDAALQVLRSTQHSRARAAYEFGEAQLKVILARATLASELKTVDDRKNEALTSDDYAKALEAHRLVSEAYFGAKDRREAADAVLRAYQTQQSDNRATGRVV